MQFVSAGGNLHEILKPIVLEKNQKVMPKCHLQKMLPSMLSVKWYLFLVFFKFFVVYVQLYTTKDELSARLYRNSK